MRGNRHRPPPTRYGPGTMQPKAPPAPRGKTPPPPLLPARKSAVVPPPVSVPRGVVKKAGAPTAQLKPVAAQRPAAVRLPAPPPPDPLGRRWQAGVVQRAQVAAPVVVQAPQAQAQETITIAARQPITFTRHGSFIRLDQAVAAEAYIYDPQIRQTAPGQFDIPDAALRGALDRFLAGNLMLYRGVPHWHPLFFTVLNHQQLNPLGNGQLPDTSTIHTKFIPFSPDQITARNFSKTRASGFNDADQMEFVANYNPNNAAFEVGITVRVPVAVNDGIGFINSSEVQLAGPIAYGTYAIDLQLRAGSPIADLHTGLATHNQYQQLYGNRTLGETLPDKPTIAQIVDYRARFGSLRHGAAIIATTGAWVADNQRANCAVCNAAFTWKKWRHHCRVCGEVVCDDCSTGRANVQNPLTEHGHANGVQNVRVCDNCMRRS